VKNDALQRRSIYNFTDLMRAAWNNALLHKFIDHHHVLSLSLGPVLWVVAIINAIESMLSITTKKLSTFDNITLQTWHVHHDEFSLINE